MYYFSDTELAQMLNEWRDLNGYTNCWWWYRDCILQAEGRGLVKIIVHTPDNPFWCRKFNESIELTDKIKVLMDKFIIKGATR